MLRLFLDTNIYIIGQLQPSSDEETILKWIGFNTPIKQNDIEIIISQELIEQILRVSKRIQNKDWGGKITNQIWQYLNVIFIPETDEMKAEANQLLTNQLIPAEDIYIYLGAKYGQADCFISCNRELVKSIADFECLTPSIFVNKYIN